MAKMPHQVPGSNLTMKRGTLGRGAGVYTIKLGNIVIATARSMAEAGNSFGAAPATGRAHIGHEVAHTLQQTGGRSPQAGPKAPPPPPPPPPPPVLTIDYTVIDWDYSIGPSPELGLKSRAGQMVKVEQGGRMVLEGRLKSVRKKGSIGDVWSMELTNARQM